MPGIRKKGKPPLPTPIHVHRPSLLDDESDLGTPKGSYASSKPEGVRRAFSLSPRLLRKIFSRQKSRSSRANSRDLAVPNVDPLVLSRHNSMKHYSSGQRSPSFRRQCGSAPALGSLRSPLSASMTSLISNVNFLKREISTLAQSISNPTEMMKEVLFMQEEKAMAQAPREPIEISRFPQYVLERKKKRLLFKGEFMIIKRSVEQHAMEFATRKENIQKNGYREVMPFDYNRVILKPLPDIPNSHYINASYIDSFYQAKSYIVTQACKTKQARIEFWRMVWEQESNCIVMLTKVFDFMKVMCLQYIPLNRQTYGDITVEVERVTTYSFFVIRVLRISKSDGSESRLVMHFHYTEWELTSFPYISAFLEFRRRVRKYLDQSPSKGPLIVHCSNGGVRSGIFVAVDSNLELAQEEHMIDVFGCCKQLINARSHMVNDLDSYIYMYDVLLEAVQCDLDPFPVHELQSRVIKYMQMKNDAQENQYAKEFKLLTSLTPSLRIGDCAGGHRQENRGKNRDVMVVPPDNARPYLSTLHGESEDYTYVNAVYCDGFQRRKEWVVMEWPKQNTIDSLWALLFDHNCHTLICLSNQGSPKLYPRFIHDKGKANYGPFQVEILQHTFYSHMTCHTVKIIKRTFMLPEVMSNESGTPQEEQEVHICQIFMTRLWPIDHRVPLSTTGLIDLIKHARSWQARQMFNPTEQKPAIVLSHNGVSRCGVYIAANQVIDQMELDQEIDVFHAAKMIRVNRPELIETKEEYKYIYDVILHYYMSMPNYVTALSNGTNYPISDHIPEATDSGYHMSTADTLMQNHV